MRTITLPANRSSAAVYLNVAEVPAIFPLPGRNGDNLLKTEE